MPGASPCCFLWRCGGVVSAAAEEEGIDSGNYNIKQSVEFGYRFTNFTGNQATYDTFLNLQQGPRLMDMTLEMRSLNHQGLVFDRLYLSNFGYGGDPNNVSRLRIVRTSGTTLTPCSAATRMSGTTRCWPTR